MTPLDAAQAPPPTPPTPLPLSPSAIEIRLCALFVAHTKDLVVVVSFVWVSLPIFFFFFNFFFRLLNFWSVPKLVPILVSFNFGGFQRLRYVERGANVLTGHRRRCHGNVNGRHSVAIQLLIDDVTITTD